MHFVLSKNTKSTSKTTRVICIYLHLYSYFCIHIFVSVFDFLHVFIYISVLSIYLSIYLSNTMMTPFDQPLSQGFFPYFVISDNAEVRYQKGKVVAPNPRISPPKKLLEKFKPMDLV